MSNSVRYSNYVGTYVYGKSDQQNKHTKIFTLLKWLNTY